MQFYFLVLSSVGCCHISSYYLDTYKRKNCKQICNRNAVVKFIIYFKIQEREMHFRTFF
jgi:hypothetical protein